MMNVLWVFFTNKTRYIQYVYVKLVPAKLNWRGMHDWPEDMGTGKKQEEEDMFYVKFSMFKNPCVYPGILGGGGGGGGFTSTTTIARCH